VSRPTFLSQYSTAVQTYVDNLTTGHACLLLICHGVHLPTQRLKVPTIAGAENQPELMVLTNLLRLSK